MESSLALLRLQGIRASLTASERKVAETILKAPREVIHLSITGIAERAKVSDATVIRLCKRLGMQGYQELKLAIAQDLVTPTERIYEDIQEADTIEDILNKVFQATKRSLDFTRSIIDSEQLENAVAAILSARKVHIYGCGNSASVALDMQHKLMSLQINVSAHMDSHMQCIASIQLRAGDVCVAISHSGSSKAIIESAKLAKEAGATVICMTGVGPSPLSKISDLRLDAASQEVNYHIVALSSRIAQYTIIDSLYTALAMRINALTPNNEQIIENALKNLKY